MDLSTLFPLGNELFAILGRLKASLSFHSISCLGWYASLWAGIFFPFYNKGTRSSMAFQYTVDFASNANKLQFLIEFTQRKKCLPRFRWAWIALPSRKVPDRKQIKRTPFSQFFLMVAILSLFWKLSSLSFVSGILIADNLNKDVVKFYGFLTQISIITFENVKSSLKKHKAENYVPFPHSALKFNNKMIAFWNDRNFENYRNCLHPLRIPNYLFQKNYSISVSNRKGCRNCPWKENGWNEMGKYGEWTPCGQVYVLWTFNHHANNEFACFF